MFLPRNNIVGTDTVVHFNDPQTGAFGKSFDDQSRWQDFPPRQRIGFPQSQRDANLDFSTW